MENAANPSWEVMTIRQKMDFVRAVSIYPALTVMVFIRRKIGFRMVKPTWLVILTVLMLLGLVFFSGFARPFPFLVVLYALSMLGLGLFQRWKRWGDLCGGVRWHTYSPGVSYLERLPLPDFFRSNSRVNRFLDPAAVALVGVPIAFLSLGLGLWIIFAALFLYVYEQSAYDHALARDLDTLDGLIASEVQAETVKHFEQPQPEQKQRSIEETAGIPTGLAPDIQLQIELRRAKKRKTAPDNIVPEATVSPT
jgi:hypothetical protein